LNRKRRICSRAVVLTAIIVLLLNTFSHSSQYSQSLEDKVRSLVRALLDNSPPAVVYVGKGCDYSVIISSQHKPSREFLRQCLPEWGEERRSRIDCHVPESLQSHSHDVLQRVSRPDEISSDDISVLVKQGQSNPKQIRDEGLFLRMDCEGHLLDLQGVA
jgi:hypothetical protein